ncbi:E2 [Capra hircus papillomavirus type 2]|uniref:Regulatory protein E2 n=1 Tax=Capra hircus papillomavirus type 2 TaxID=485388 RepID=A0A6G7ACH5_9PAPI|nr:E2 [Capra hircus papillomavirus type 2]
MESLEARFDAVQEQLIETYESETNTLDMQIRHWLLIRKEQALYYLARTQGKTRLGLYQVPPTRVSEKKAKDAIKMSLYLQSLRNSPFANQPWSLVDTSLETFMSAPENMFKKRGASVTVVYDKDAANSMMYTLWKELYYLGDDDVWYKTTSEADYDGIFYRDFEGSKVYYVNFSEDAGRYSTLGQWEVLYENQVLSPPVTSSLPGPSGSKPPRPETMDYTAASETETTATRSQPPQPAAQRRLVQPLQQRQRSNSSISRRARKRQRSRSSSLSRSLSPSSGAHSAFLNPSPRRQRDRRPLGQHCRGTTGGAFGESPPPSPELVGSRTQTPSRKASTRVGQLIEEAYDPPILLLQGCANTLKCFRRRTSHSHPHKFLCMSTSWSWVSKTSPLKSGHRMLVAFTSSSQRDIFLATVRLPKGVSWVKGSLDGL